MVQIIRRWVHKNHMKMLTHHPVLFELNNYKWDTPRSHNGFGLWGDFVPPKIDLYYFTFWIEYIKQKLMDVIYHDTAVPLIQIVDNLVSGDIIKTHDTSHTIMVLSEYANKHGKKYQSWLLDADNILFF